MLSYCCFCCLACFCTLLFNPATCIDTIYKLAGKDGDTTVDDKNVPFLTQSFFTCGSNEDCAELAKTKGSNDFREVIGQQKVNEDAVVYEKISTPKMEAPSWSEWNIVKCSAKYRGGKATFVRYCYSHLPCIGESSKVETCNTEGYPGLQNCTHNTTSFTNGNDSVQGHNSWYPLLNQKPLCRGSGGAAIMTGVKLEKAGTDIRYNFTCCNFKDPVCHATTKSTPWNDYGAGNPRNLDRHIMECGSFGFISSFQLENDNSRIRYVVWCCELSDSKWKNSMQCSDKSTQYVADNGHSIYTMAQVPVQCEAGFGLSRLRLQRVTFQDWGYGFRCCKVIH